jgi:hypothetical protein
MKTLYEVAENPSGLDSFSNYMGETPSKNKYVVLTRSRDSDCLTESNWECALEMLGGESDTVQIDRFGHWACGWWEALSVTKGSKEAVKAEEIESALSDYPVLCEDHFSGLEQSEANRVWHECYDASERIEYIRENSYKFEFHDFADLLSCCRGEYFGGYASELLY